MFWALVLGGVIGSLCAYWFGYVHGRAAVAEEAIRESREHQKELDRLRAEVTQIQSRAEVALAVLGLSPSASETESARRP